MNTIKQAALEALERANGQPVERKGTCSPSLAHKLHAEGLAELDVSPGRVQRLRITEAGRAELRKARGTPKL